MVRATIVCALLLLGSLATADEALQAQVDDLGSADNTTRVAAYQALNRSKDPAVVGLLMKVLPEYDEISQYYGVMVMQRQPPKVARPAFKKLLGTSSVHLRVLAGAALQRMGAREGVPAIVAGLKDPSITDALRATLLGRIYSVRDPAIQETVRGFLKLDTPLTVLQAAVYNIYLVRDALARTPLKALLTHEATSVRALCGSCLLLLGDASGAEAVAGALAEGVTDSGTLYKVKNLLAQVKPVPAVILAAMHARLEDETATIALRILIEMLGEHGYGKAAKPIRALLDHEDATVSKAAFEALARLPGGVSPETMRALLKTGDDARRLAAADALRRADDPSGLPVVIAILKDATNLQDRYEAARMLANFRSAEAIEPLLDALMDEQSSVRSNAFGSLSTLLRTLYPYRRFDPATAGYAYSAPAAQREAGVAKLRAWWEAHKGSDW